MSIPFHLHLYIELQHLSGTSLHSAGHGLELLS